MQLRLAAKISALANPNESHGMRFQSDHSATLIRRARKPQSSDAPEVELGNTDQSATLTATTANHGHACG